MRFHVLLLALVLNLSGAIQAPQLWYHLSGSTHGPFSPEQLEAWWRGGYFPSDMQVSEDPSMGSSMPVAQLFSPSADGTHVDGYSMADYSDDDDMSPFSIGGQGFNLGNAREAAQKLASMDVKEYKERASELATDIRYAAKDSLVKAKEMSSIFGLKVADKLGALKQKVKESTGQANPGYSAQQEYYHYQQQNGGSFQQQQGGAYEVQAGNYGTQGEAKAQSWMPPEAEQPPLSVQQSEAAAAVYDAVEHAFHRGTGDTESTPVQEPLITLAGPEMGTGGSGASDSSRQEGSSPAPRLTGAESGRTDSAPEQAKGVSAVASGLGAAGSQTDGDDSLGVSTGTGADGGASTSSGSASPVAEEGMTQRDYENVYQPWEASSGVSAEQQDERYAQRQGEQQQEQQWYYPYEGQDQQDSLNLALASETEATQRWSGLEEDLSSLPMYDGGAGGGIGSSYYSDDSDDDYAGILEQDSRGSSTVRKLMRRVVRRTRRLFAVGRAGRVFSRREAGTPMSMHMNMPMHMPGSAPAPPSPPDFALRSASASASAAAAKAGGESALSSLIKGSRANAQVCLTAVRNSPACSLLLLGSLAALPALLIVSASGIPAAVRQLVVFTSASGDIHTGASGTVHEFPGSGLLRSLATLVERAPLVAGIPGAHAFIESVLGALEATPTCVLVLMLIQRIAVIALAVVPALLSTMETAVGRDQRSRRDASRGYPDPLDGALWSMVGKLRFRRLSEAAALVYLPVVIALMVKLAHQALGRVRIFTAREDAPLAIPEFTGPLRVTLVSCLVEGVIVLWTSVHQHARAAAAAAAPSASYAGAVSDGVPALASRDTTGAFPSLLLVLMLNSFVRTGQAHAAGGGKPWNVLPAARKLLSAEIRRTRRLLDEAFEEQHGVMQGAFGAGAGAGVQRGGEVSAEEGWQYRPYSHSPVALTRRGMYSLAVFTSTLLATGSCLKLLARHDHLRITVASQQDEGRGTPLQLPLDGVIWLLRRFGRSLFVGLSDPSVSPIAAGFNYNADRGLYLGVNILLAVLSLVPISLWCAFAGAVVRYQHYDDELLSLSAAVKAPIPTSVGGRDASSGRSSGRRGRSEPATTSFRTVISSATEPDRGVSVAGRVNLHDARAILEAVALEHEYRSSP